MIPIRKRPVSTRHRLLKKCSLVSSILLISTTIVLLAPPRVAFAMHNDCDEPSVTVYCNASLQLYYDGPNIDMKVRGVMAGWQQSNLQMSYKVYENGDLIWQDSLGNCVNSTSCDKNDWFFACEYNKRYTVVIDFWSNAHPHHLTDGETVLT